jgi:hypothetical protein
VQERTRDPLQRMKTI